MRSRTRSKSKYSSCIRCTLNPEENHISYQYCKRYLDDEGFPIKDLSGKIAYFTYVNGVLYTAWTEKELHEELGKLITKKDLLISYPEEYVNKKLLSAYGNADLKEFMWVEGIKNYCYIPSTLADNEILRKTEIEYASSLQALPEAKRKQLLLGCWHASSTVGELWRQEWVKLVEGDAINATRCRAWDIAGTEHDPNSTGYAKNPDWTAGVLMSKYKDGEFAKTSKFRIEDVVRVRKTMGDVVELIYQTALEDMGRYGDNYMVFIPTDPNPMAKDNTKQIIAGLLEKGIKAVTDPTRAPKVDRFQGFALACENGMVEVTQADWNKAFFNELESFSSDKTLQKKRKDDQCDAVGDAYRILNTRKSIVVPSLPNLPNISTKISQMRKEIG